MKPPTVTPETPHVYVVYGSTGEYSDHVEWYVAAYHDENAARIHVIEAERCAREAEVKYASRFDVPEGVNAWDLNMQMDYTDVRYAYATVPLFL